MLAPAMLTSGPTSSPPRWAASSPAEKRMRHLADRKVEIGVWIRLVLECVVPPLPGVGAKPAGGHDRVQVSTVCRFNLRDPWCSVMGNRVQEGVVIAHRSELNGGRPPACR